MNNLNSVLLNAAKAPLIYSLAAFSNIRLILSPMDKKDCVLEPVECYINETSKTETYRYFWRKVHTKGRKGPYLKLLPRQIVLIICKEQIGNYLL